MDINAIATDILLAAESLKNVSLDTIREKYCAGENGRDTHLAALNAAVKFLHDFTEDPTTETETMAKAAAYDQVKAIADKFVRNFTQNAGCIPDAAALSKHLEESQQALAAFKRIEANAQTMNLSTEQYALLLSNQVAQLSKQLQQKDAEVAQLRQAVQQKESEIAQLKAAQVPTPTP
ncbi:MAG: hypothetical protein VZR64_01340 [Eubacterium sp.]|nr:hypothetical protein [Eubacterium sp.]